MAKLTWDAVGARLFETGIDKCVLYVYDKDSDHPYTNGVAWNGITGVTESPDGAEPEDLYADNIKYLSLQSAETLGASITAYMYPAAFAACDGTEELVEGIMVGQQSRKTFGLSYRTLLGNDTENTDHGYKLHLIYGCVASPSDKDYSTVNDSPEAIEFSWDIKTTPVDAGDNLKKTASLVIDSTVVDARLLALIETALYGAENATPYLPMPADILAMAESLTDSAG